MKTCHNLKSHSKRIILPFLGDALKWLIGTAATKDTWEIKQCVNQLIQKQTKQWETPGHVTRYAIQVNSQKLNEINDALQRSNEDLNRLFSITEVLTLHIKIPIDVHLHAHHTSLS